MARMRCYSPRTGHDHGTGVAGLALPLASGPRRGGFGVLLGAFPARAPGPPALPGPSGPPGCAPTRLSRDGHQFHRPSRITVHGTRTVRTMNVSISTPSASPTPTSRIWLPPEPRPPTRANTANVPASTSPAEVTVVPVAPSARLTASRSEASRTPGRRWGSCRLVGRRWPSEATISQCPGYQEVGFSKSPARSLIIQMAPSGVTPVRGAPGGAQERAPPVSPSSPGRWGTLANVIRDSGRYRSEPCR